MNPSASPTTMPQQRSGLRRTVRRGARPRPADPRAVRRLGGAGGRRPRTADPAVPRLCAAARSTSAVDGPGGAGGRRRTEEHLLPHRRLHAPTCPGTSATWRHWETLRAFERAVGQLSEIRHEPVRLAADLHPGYHTRSWAERHAGDRPLDLVQHHHAHVVSLLAEHGRIGEPIDRGLVRRHRLRLRPDDLGRRDSHARAGQPPVRAGRPPVAGATARR